MNKTTDPEKTRLGFTVPAQVPKLAEELAGKLTEGLRERFPSITVDRGAAIHAALHHTIRCMEDLDWSSAEIFDDE